MKNWKNKSRGGQEIRIYTTDGIGQYPIHGAIKRDSGWQSRTWTEFGETICSQTSNDDLIAEPNYRPFTNEELPRVVGRRIRHKEFRYVQIIIGELSSYVFSNCDAYAKIYPDDLLSLYEFLDFDDNGNEIVTPCGVQE